MDENRFEGTARNIGGNVKSTIGDLTGDEKMQAEGMMDQGAGKAQRAYGQAADKARSAAASAGDYGSELLDTVEEYGDILAEKIDARPITSVLIAAGIGFLIAMATKPSPKVVYRRR